MPNRYYEYDDEYICHHGKRGADCEDCDAEIDANGGIDKCLNCGKYKYGNELNEFQCCIRQCVNPNEY